MSKTQMWCKCFLSPPTPPFLILHVFEVILHLFVVILSLFLVAFSLLVVVLHQFVAVVHLCAVIPHTLLAMLCLSVDTLRLFCGCVVCLCDHFVCRFSPLFVLPLLSYPQKQKT